MNEADEFLVYLEKEVRMARTTVKGYGSDIRVFCAWLDAPVTSVTRETAKSYLHHLNERELKVATLHRCIAACGAFYRWMVDEGQVPTNPFRGLKLPKQGERLPRFITLEDFNRLVDFNVDSELDARDKAILELLVSSGIRVGELEHLTVDSVDMQGCKIMLVGKGNRERTVVFGQVAQLALRDWLFMRRGMARCNALFLNYAGQPLQQQSIQEMMHKRSLESLGFTVTPHQLRHSCATWMRNGGADLNDIGEQLGHQDLKTTRIYAHVNTRRMSEIHTRTHPRAVAAERLHLVASAS